jgi:hypothetical protein
MFIHSPYIVAEVGTFPKRLKKADAKAALGGAIPQKGVQAGGSARR